MLMPSIFKNNFAEDVFDEFFFPTSSFRYRNRAVAMNADVRERKDSYEIALDLPGYQKEDVKAELSEGYLTISAEHSVNENEGASDEKFIRRERYFGQVQRSFYVGEAVSEEDIKASFENGVLNLSIAKKDEKEKIPEKKMIEIEG